MPFVPIIRNTGRSQPTEPRVRFYINRTSHGCVFALTRPIIEAMGWCLRDRIAVSFGIGADIGKASLTRIEKGGQQLSGAGAGKNLFTVAISLPRFVGKIDREIILDALPNASTCSFEITDGQLIVTLPKPRIAAVSVAA